MARNDDEPAKAAASRDVSPAPAEAAAAFTIVGIGASAGGLEAFKEMLAALPHETGMAYVLVLHLPPHHESLLSEILGRISPLPLGPLHDGIVLEPNHVYVLPAGYDLDLSDGAVRLTPRVALAGQHRPVDRFFHSLAEHHGHKAIGVILSGTASDGALGVQEIKAAGGITFAQDESAQQGSMPRSAIQTGAIDFVLNPTQIATELGRIAQHPIAVEPDEAEVPDLEPVIDVLRETEGVDFTNYKRKTLYRRIVRRILLHKLDGLQAYVEYLRETPGEAAALYQDFLISVTSFFRNPEAFEALKAEVFPALTENRSRHDPVRIWTLGCSTGEEAYSLAMAFAEYADHLGRSVPVQVFATDLNHASIDRARTGMYPRAAVSELSAERVRRFFVEIDGHYRIAKEIRDACIFARHNVLEDPPFSRMDLVSCRNMLIYLGTELQQKVIPVLHYALRPNGHLWLGTSETIGSYRDLFELKHPRYKIYAKKGAAGQLPALGGAGPRIAAPTAGIPAYLPAPESKAFDAQREIDRLLISRYAPPSVLINSELEIIQYRGNTGPYLTPAPGRASLNVLKMVRDGLVLGVRAAVQRAKSEETPVRQEGLTLGTDGGERRVNVEVIPVKGGVQRAGLFMVLFEDVPQPEPRPAPADVFEEGDERLREIAQLKQDLTATREYLQSVIEQQEAANEELQSANEEVQSANEELQSINEELETSKEEVQSSNEELATVNDELQGRNAELAQSNNDLTNLLASVQLAIVMLGPNMRIRRFTPMAEKLFNLAPTDMGRPLSDLNGNLYLPDMDHLVASVMDSMSSYEREVRDKQGRWYLLRIRPYRTLENRIDGAVVVLVDVDTLKNSQEQLRQQTELLNQAHEPIIMWKLDGDVNYWNKAAEETYGFTRDQAIGRKTHELLMTTPPFESFRDALREASYWSGELVHTRRDGQKIIVESRMVVVIDPQGDALVIEANRPITERKETEVVLRRIADDLVTADRNKDEFLAMLAHELRNPLAPLRNVVAALKSPSIGKAESERALDIMERQIGNMARLIDDLLDVSRITLSQIELRREQVDLVATVRRVVENHESSLKAKNQTVRVHVPEDPVYVEGDVVRLEQLLGNLVHNAWKYTDAGGDIAISVDVEGARRGQAAREAVIRVRDNGIGIDRERLPDVFDLFMRATRSIDQRYGGLGIGLTLVRRIAELHGGRVEAHSEGAGKGAEFAVRLPLLGADTSRRVDAPEAGRVDAAPRRVLVVDDNIDNAESLAMSMRSHGHRVKTANSGPEALKLLRKFRPEVMLIDIGMPQMDGYALSRELRKVAPNDIKLVALSGYSHAEARERAREAGFDEYLVKPAGVDDINAVFARFFA